MTHDEKLEKIIKTQRDVISMLALILGSIRISGCSNDLDENDEEELERVMRDLNNE